ncbi:unnamed protein product, partial [Meganyctiphanes norvegica]
GCPEGFFMAPSSSKQCFKFGRYVNWTMANSTCHSEGLVMARPYNAVALRSYLVQRFGYWSTVWLNAQGTGSYVRWKDGSNQVIYSSNPLWYSGYPGSYTSTSYCLTLYAYSAGWKSYPQQPYVMTTCSTSRYTLCELVSE